MIDEQTVLSRITGISVVQLRVWVSQEWVRPARSGATMVYNEADIARIQLLHLLGNQLGVGNEAIPIILSLIDQVHDLRGQMQIISRVVESQPDDVRAEILQRLRERP